MFWILFEDKVISVNLNFLKWFCISYEIQRGCAALVNVTNLGRTLRTCEVVPPPGGGRFELQPQPGRVKWAAGRSKVKLTDTLIKTSDPFKPCGRLQPAISEEIQKETKYCSEAILKEIQYLHWTKRYVICIQEKINKTRNVFFFFVHIHSMTNHIQLVNIDPVRPEETEILVGNSDYCWKP